MRAVTRRGQAAMWMVGYAPSALTHPAGWERGRARPLGGVRAYLMIIERDAKSVLDLLRKVRGKKAA